jgi:lysosomal alpha-mannosidase
LVARGKHFLIFGSKTDQHPTLEGRERMLQNRVLVPNWLFFDDVSSTSYDDWMKKYTNIVSTLSKIEGNLMKAEFFFAQQHSGIGLSLPQNVYLMTFEPWKDGASLIRFEHILEKNEDPELSQPVRFNLNDVFPGNDIVLREVSLSGNQWIEDFQRLHFTQESAEFLDGFANKTVHAKASLDDLEITLNPMEIRTFIMTLYPTV